MLKNPDLRIAVVCSVNMNRSMQAQALLQDNGFNVRSYGVNCAIKLPGKIKDRPNVYEFGTNYESIYEDLEKKDKVFYMATGVLPMLKRNLAMKKRPERFQESEEIFDVIVTLEERVFDRVIESLDSRYTIITKPVHVININVTDSLKGAIGGSYLVLELLNQLTALKDLDNEICYCLQKFEFDSKQPILHTVLFY